HAGNVIDIQDFLVIPVGADSFARAMEMVFNVYHATGRVFKRNGMSVAVSDEGGFWPAFAANETALSFLTEGISEAGYTPGEDVCIALDVASSHFFADGLYRLSTDQQEFSRPAFINLQEEWV